MGNREFDALNLDEFKLNLFARRSGVAEMSTSERASVLDFN